MGISGDKMGKTILIADDEEHLGFMVKFKLEKSGFHVLWEMDGNAAFAAIESQKPDLVILDVMMPGLTGYEVLQKIKANDALKDIPVIMLTAEGQESDLVNGIEMGASDYIIKPFRPAELMARIKRFIPIS